MSNEKNVSEEQLAEVSGGLYYLARKDLAEQGGKRSKALRQRKRRAYLRNKNTRREAEGILELRGAGFI